MLQPKRTKFRKVHRGRLRGRKIYRTLKPPTGIAHQSSLRQGTGPWKQRGNGVVFGDFALQALEPCWLTGRQIEAGRRVISRRTKRGGQIWIHPFPDKPVTFRPAETRMGSGKGTPEYWVAVVKPGQILYEIKGVPLSIARTALKNASYKMPIQTKIIAKKI